MSDTTLTDEERRAAIVQQMREQTGIDEGMIEQLVRGGSYATCLELGIASSHGVLLERGEGFDRRQHEGAGND